MEQPMPGLTQPISKKNFKKIQQLRAETAATLSAYDERINVYNSKKTTSDQSLKKKAWTLQAKPCLINSAVNLVSQPLDHIVFTIIDSGADVNIKHNDGSGLDDFDPSHSIILEVAKRDFYQRCWIY